MCNVTKAFAYLCLFVCVCVCVCVCACMYAYGHVCVHMQMCVCACAYIVIVNSTNFFVAADAALSESYHFPSAEHNLSMSPGGESSDIMSSLLRPSRLSGTEVPYYVHKGELGYGIVLQSVRVYIDKHSDKYRLHHILQVCNN